tara:strand:- start:127 stop:714 length:588 start_codon:yes stop_codon:yes gene_type:complete
MIWEEHILYFTKNSLIKLLKSQGLKIHYFEVYKYSYENVLIIITKIDNNKKLKTFKKIKNKQIHFTKRHLFYDQIKIRNIIQKFKNSNFKICLFGTGHAASMFLNLIKIQDLVDVVIDDDKNKDGYYLPNSNLKIQNSKILKKFDNVMIILGVNAESEKKILMKLKNYQGNIMLYSIYNKSKYSFNSYDINKKKK